MSIHIGIVPDKNRTYCKRLGKPLSYLVEHWFNNMILPTIKKFLNGDYSILKNLKKIKEISLYVSSIDNTKRIDGSLKLGYNLVRKLNYLFYNREKFFKKCELEILDSTIKFINEKIDINLIGNREMIPKDVLDIYKKFKKSRDSLFDEKDVFYINLACCYDPKKDMKYYKNDSVKNDGYTRNQSDIDLIYRTGGQNRLSGFFPVQTCYSELIVSDKLWPETTINDISEAIDKFKRIKRNFGK